MSGAENLPIRSSAVLSHERQNNGESVGAIA